ncbi:MAG TPA: hypothetical protein VGN80_19170 [Devosiaceae bacterium]|jgi:hypothetical protein|nr:hypothetical protein [Devosiaceae bacterium]
MTLGELHFLLERLAAAGCSADQLVAAARAARDWKVEQELLRAVRRALAPETAVSPAQQRPASPAPKMNEADSGVRVVHVPMDGAATASGGGPKSVARAALLMMPGLSPAARKVGGRLIERYNLTSGRCDPSTAGLAEDLDLTMRSVRRAVAELVHAGLFRRVIHGGYSHRNAYVPTWAALRAAAVASEVAGPKMNEADSAPTRTLRSADPDERVRQNLRRKPIGESSGGGRHRAKPPDSRQREFLYPVSGGGGMAMGDAARGAAQSRVWAATHAHLKSLGKDSYVTLLSEVDDATLQRAVDAELRHRGSGLQALLIALNDPRAPPTAASG